MNLRSPTSKPIESVDELRKKIAALEENCNHLEQELRCTRDGLDNAVFAVLRITQTGELAYCNDAACRALGYPPAELLQQNICHLDEQMDADGFQDLWRRAESGEQVTFTTQHRRRDGFTFSVEVTVRFCENENEPYCFAFCVDIHEKNRADAQRAMLEAQLRQQQKIEAISTLASGVAHEINNPINIVMNYAELIIARSQPESQTVPFAREIINESHRIATIVRNLLAFAREEKEIRQLEHVEEIIDRTLSLMREVLHKTSIELHVEIERGLPQITCQMQQIQQVLMNLLTNARDALLEREGERKITINADRIQEERGDFVRITIDDNGPGIAGDVAERIFDPFFTTKQRDKGTGLGLSVSLGIITAHGGTLTFRSAPGTNTSFLVALPVSEQELTPE